MKTGIRVPSLVILLLGIPAGSFLRALTLTLEQAVALALEDNGRLSN